MNPRTRVRAVWALLVAVLLSTAGGLAPRAAYAAGDTIQSWDATYDVEKSGDVTVTEKLTYVFPRSDAQGMTRGLVIREPWDGGKEHDRTYDVDIVSVTATDGVSASYTQKEEETEGGGPDGANQQLLLRIGTRGQYVPASTPITYTITYRITDAMVTTQHGQELYWDVVPSDLPLSVQQATATVRMPSGTQYTQVNCQAGKTGSAGGGCDAPAQSGETVTLLASDLGKGRGMSVGTIVPDGTVAKTGPTLVESVAKAEQRKLMTGAGAVGVSSLVSVLGGLWWWRRNGRDERFVGLPPGIVPGPGEAATVGRDTKPEIPVAFSPPRISPGEAGLLIDSVVDVRDTTATLVDLAVRGVLAINSDGEKNRLVVMLRDPSIPVAPHERAFLDKVFSGASPGTEVDLSSRGDMVDAHEAVKVSLLQTVADRGWFTRRPSALGGFKGLAAVMPFILGALFFFPGLLGSILTKGGIFLLALIPLALLLIVLGVLRMKGKRSAQGRAVTDQVQGFRTYLATAEAEQLRFEEGEDIFSKYLPWAIMFDLADRWTKVCQQLVAMGRIPDYQPSWYYGYWYGFGSFDVGHINDSLTSAATPVQTDSGSGSGFGGGSSFGGGSVGGGGGGGSAGSW